MKLDSAVRSSVPSSEICFGLSISERDSLSYITESSEVLIKLEMAISVLASEGVIAGCIASA
jgi:hypothetical protein